MSELTTAPPPSPSDTAATAVRLSRLALFGGVGAAVALLLVLRPWSTPTPLARTVYGWGYLLTMTALTGLLIVGRRRTTCPERLRIAASWRWAEVVCVLVVAVLVIVTVVPGGLGEVPVRDGVLLALIGAAGLGVQAFIAGWLRARLGGRRDVEGLLDAWIVSATVAVVVWDALTRTIGGRAPFQGVSIVVVLVLLAAVAGANALQLRVYLTGVGRFTSGRLLGAVAVLQLLLVVLIATNEPALAARGVVWEAELVSVLDVACVVAAGLHPSGVDMMRPMRQRVLDAGNTGRGRLAMLFGSVVLAVAAGAWRTWWVADEAARLGTAPPLSQLLPSAVLTVSLTAAAAYRVWRLIEERNAIQDRLADVAETDDLTGLPNRRSLRRELRHRVGAAVGADHGGAAPLAVLFMDLDGFKAVNDLHGHDAGDEVLLATTRRIDGMLREGDVLGRIAGDEFVALCRGPIDAATAQRIADRVQQAVERPLSIDDHDLSIGVSIGIALAARQIPDPAEECGRLLRAADRAMYAGKQTPDSPPVLATPD